MTCRSPKHIRKKWNIRLDDVEARHDDLEQNLVQLSFVLQVTTPRTSYIKLDRILEM